MSKLAGNDRAIAGIWRMDGLLRDWERHHRQSSDWQSIPETKTGDKEINALIELDTTFRKSGRRFCLVTAAS